VRRENLKKLTKLLIKVIGARLFCLSRNDHLS
jgi:hypothetical protein